MKKKVTSVILIAVVMLSMLTAISPVAKAGTMRTWDEGYQWLLSKLGKIVWINPAYGVANCTDFVSAYMNYVTYGDPTKLHSPFTTYMGYAYYENFYNAMINKGFGCDRIPYSSPSFSPQPGDIICWNAKISAGGTGHVAIVEWAYPGGVHVIQENYNDARGVHGKDFTLNATSCQGLIRPHYSQPPIPITGVSLNTTIASLNPGNSIQLTATISPSNTTDSKTLTWTSSNPNAAIVTSNGFVTAVKPGTATITVTTSNGKTATCAVNVSVLTNIAVSQSTVYLKKGSSATLGVVPVTSDNSKPKLTWVSSDPNTISVTQTGKVKALKDGSAIITATADNVKSVKINVIVGGSGVSSISIANPPPGKTMKVGEELKLIINIKPANAQGVLIFKSINSKVASIDAAGQLKALKKGITSIVVVMGLRITTLYLKVT